MKAYHVSSLDRISLLLALLMLSSPYGAKASTESRREVERIVLQLSVRDLPREEAEIRDLEAALKKVPFKLNHPHKVVNPAKKQMDFAGDRVETLLGPLLTKVGLKIADRRVQESTVSFVGRDSYTVAMPVRDAIAGGAMVVGFQEGKRIGWRAGAPFLAFTSASPGDYWAEPSWWGWWISAIVVGQPDPTLVVDGKTVSLETIKKACGQPIEGKLNYPRGRRKVEPPRVTKGKLAACPLEAFGLGKPARGKGYVAEFLTGQSRRISDPAKHRVVFAFNDEPIPVPLGGPLQLCDVDGSAECSYFLSSLRRE